MKTGLKVGLLFIIMVQPSWAARTIFFSGETGGATGAGMYATCNLRINNLGSTSQTIRVELIPQFSFAQDTTHLNSQFIGSTTGCVSTMSRAADSHSTQIYTFNFTLGSLCPSVSLMARVHRGAAATGGCRGKVIIQEDQGLVGSSGTIVVEGDHGEFQPWLTSFAINGGRPF